MGDDLLLLYPHYRGWYYLISWGLYNNPIEESRKKKPAMIQYSSIFNEMRFRDFEHCSILVLWVGLASFPSPFWGLRALTWWLRIWFQWLARSEQRSYRYSNSLLNEELYKELPGVSQPHTRVRHPKVRHFGTSSYSLAHSVSIILVMWVKLSHKPSSKSQVQKGGTFTGHSHGWKWIDLFHTH